MKSRKAAAGVSLVLAAVMILLSFTVYGASSEEAQRFGTLEWYSSFTSQSSIKDSFYYSDEWFLEDPEVQNDALALVSMQLVAAAVVNDENGTGTTFLKNLGFEQTGLAGFENPDPEGCGLTWGTKTIGEGEDAFTLAAIAIQSLSFDQAVKQIGWRQNFLVNGETITEEHVSYAKAADYAAEQVAQLDISGKVKYWITGQSRGGAIAGALAARLKKDADSVYAYTFESPANVEQSAVQENASDYGYIHNYLCSDDVVTMIPPWGMTRYGAAYPLNTTETTEPLEQMLLRMGSDAATVAQEYDPEKIESNAARLIQTLMDGIPSREEYSSLHTDLFADPSGQEIRISYRYQDLFTGLMQLVFGNVLEGVDTDKLGDEIPQLLPTVTSLYKAVKEGSQWDYYEAACGLGAFLGSVGIELPLTTEDMYALLKLAGPVIIDTEFVPEGDEITQDEMSQCILPLIELFTMGSALIFSHQFDTIIARLKILAEEPEMESLGILLPEPAEGEEVSAFASQAQEAFREQGYSWLTVSAEGKTKDERFLNDKIYYLDVDLSVVGHSIPEDFAVTIDGKEPAAPLEISYADGITDIAGTWKYVLGTPGRVQVSFDMEGHGTAPDSIDTETGTALKYALSFSFPEIVSDDTGTYTFDGWYDENGTSWEELCADEDLVLHAKWEPMIDQIEIIYDIPHIGEGAGVPRVPENALWQITESRLMNEKWDEVTGVFEPGEYELDFLVQPVSQEYQFLTVMDEDDIETYTGVMIVNGEEVDAWYEAEENGVSAAYRFTVLPDPGD